MRTRIGVWCLAAVALLAGLYVATAVAGPIPAQTMTGTTTTGTGTTTTGTTTTGTGTTTTGTGTTTTGTGTTTTGTGTTTTGTGTTTTGTGTTTTGTGTTGTSVTASPSSQAVGQPVTLTATVTGGVPGGDVSFQSDGSVNEIDGCADAPVMSGVATCTTSSLAVGAHIIYADYSGDGLYDPSAGSTNLRIYDNDAKTVNIVVSPATLIADGTATATATATFLDADGNTVPGTVSFGDSPSGVLIPHQISNSDGIATFTFSAATTASMPASVTITAFDDDTDPAITGSATVMLQPSSNLTWSGAASPALWSNAQNWAADTTPSGTVGTVTFPDLSTGSCATAGGPDACYDAENDVTGLSVDGLDIVGDGGYVLSGQGLTLRGAGLSVSAPDAAGEPPDLDLPLTLGAPQTWTVDAGPVILGRDVTGDQPLTVKFKSGSLAPGSDMEVGPILATGGGGFYLSGGASLNASDSEPVTAYNGAGIEADQPDNSAGPLFIGPGGWLSIGGVGDGAGALSVIGGVALSNTYTTGGVTYGGTAKLNLAIDGPGTVPGVDYSQLDATGDIGLSGTALNLSQNADAGGNCDDLHVGDVLTLLHSSGGTIDGTFANYANRQPVVITNACNGADRDASGVLSYSPSTVTLTITAAGDLSEVPVELAPPSVSGTAQAGQTLTLDPGSWAGATSLEDSWWECTAVTCNQIAGADSATFVPTGDQVGYQIVGAVTARNAAGGDTDFTDPTAPISAEPVPVNTVAPSVTGMAVVGATLTASTGTWTNSPFSYSYQWERCNAAGEHCAPIVAAETGSYLLTSADLGSAIEVEVDASNYGGSGAPAASAAISPVTRRHLATPTAVRKISVASIRSALRRILVPTGAAATRAQILRHRGYSLSFSAPSGGRLSVTWTASVKHGTVTLARANLRIAAARAVRFKIAITLAGRTSLNRHGGLRVRAMARFAPAGMRRVSVSASFEPAHLASGPRARSSITTKPGSSALRSKLGFSR